MNTHLYTLQERMVQLHDTQKGAEVTSDVTERELELEAELVEARSIIQEQVSYHHGTTSQTFFSVGCLFFFES